MTFLVWALCVYLAVRVVAESLSKQEDQPQNLDKH
jgi:hypothetical protein